MVSYFPVTYHALKCASRLPMRTTSSIQTRCTCETKEENSGQVLRDDEMCHNDPVHIPLVSGSNRPGYLSIPSHRGHIVRIPVTLSILIHSDICRGGVSSMDTILSLVALTN